MANEPPESRTRPAPTCSAIGAAISALEQGEDHALSLYSGDMASVDVKTRKLIDIDLGPEQRRTHELCRTLQAYTRRPS